jgi:fumarate reductase flavoprotein subunit
MALNVLTTDILILGSGGAGLLAALHAHDAGRPLDITIVVKGLLGKSGCTRLVQGGYNAVLDKDDSFDRHFLDTLKAGAFINDQELAWTMVSRAPRCIWELEHRFGCFFDRNKDGSIHQKAFAGQTFDRTVHKGDLTGIEIISRLAEQVGQRSVRVLQEHRAIDLVLTPDRRGASGALVLDVRGGRMMLVHAKAILVATGGGPTMYRMTAASADKSMDGIAIGFRAGAELRDMEMVQFHPTGLLVASSLMTGTVLEEGLRGAGGHLYNGQRERFMERYDPVRRERSTRDVVARSSYLEIMAGRGSPNGGVFIDVSHLGSAFVEQHFRGMVKRCRDVGMDLAREPVEVTPTAHFQMGGLAIAADCRTTLDGLFAAGEDAGSVHGANRLGGNGVAESTVFGMVAGDAIAEFVRDRPLPPLDPRDAEAMCRQLEAPLGGSSDATPLYRLRSEMQTLMWEQVGLVRDGRRMTAALTRIVDMRQELETLRVPGGPAFNTAWQDWLNCRNLLLTCELISRSALAREESRGSHFRSDFPDTDQRELHNVCVRLSDGGVELGTRPVRFTHHAPVTVDAPRERVASAELATSGE